MHSFPERDPFGSYIYTAVFVHIPGRKNGCDCVREESDCCVMLLLLLLLFLVVVVFLQQCVGV
jgi:hypothetical protein